MLFRQLLDAGSRTFTYLVASRRGGQAVLIDPVHEHVGLYLRLLEALDLRLAFAIDTHLHHDHQSALPALLEQTDCITAMGRESRAPGVVRLLRDGERLDLGSLQLEVLHTPGHSDDSYCYVMDDRVFTGDTLLIRGTGRTDLGGDAREQYESLFGKLLALPSNTLVYPAHDYNGRHVSTLADERRLNPRLQVASAEAYVSLMESVRPPTPSLMDTPEAPSLHPASARMRELLSLKALRAEAPLFAGEARSGE
ncbi:MAG TPA: MBL fold metallo-hydrolase [Polyangiaceae bacterium]|nr:MBL fold metallo-hydrolase [Polyangiaceae bacterium]